MLIQEGGEVFRGRYDLAVCRDRRYIIRHEQMLWAIDVLPTEEVFCDEVIEGGKDGEEEAGEELLEAEALPLSLKSFLKSIFFFIFNLIFPLIFSFLFFYDPDIRLIHYPH